MTGDNTILKVDGLAVSFQTERGRLRAVDDVSFQLKQGETLGIVGESGCGKSVTAMSMMRLLPQPSGVIEDGKILFQDKDLRTLAAGELRHLRGSKISMIFQEPMTALNPVIKIGKQIAESMYLHTDLSDADITERGIRLLSEVGIPEAEKRWFEYPHQLSGGMRQRAMIAMALTAEPEVLVADEPTTALDVTTQAQILDLLRSLQKKKGMGIIMITHDLGVIAEMCDRVLVMYAGRVVEEATVSDLFKSPKHPYTKGLLSSIPSLSDTPKSKLNTIEGRVPSLMEMPKGCRFENRCQHSDSRCRDKSPILTTFSHDRKIRCFKAKEINE